MFDVVSQYKWNVSRPPKKKEKQTVGYALTTNIIGKEKINRQ